jgi:putative FmdB family regulatory protein
MPLYGYLCDACGPFTALRPMVEFRDPSPCPSCGAAAPRSVLEAPTIAGVRSGLSRAFVADDPGRASLRHAARCSCCICQ